MPDYSTRCAHGVPLVDADECYDCMALEVAKMGIIREAIAMLQSYTDDTATHAVMATAFGRFVSMKLHDPRRAPQVLHSLREVIRQALPAPKERLMIAQQVMLTDLSFEARLPE
jgi:hypothetical protein